MPNSIENFKKSFNGGTRVNRFEVSCSWPAFSTSTSTTTSADLLKYKAVSTSFPSATINPIMIPYRGRFVNYAGDRQYGVWSVEVYDDSGLDLWHYFNLWHERIDGHWTHIKKAANGNGASTDFTYNDLQTDMTVKQLDINGSPIRTIVLKKAWPSRVTQINLDMSNADPVKFSVEFMFDYFDITQGIS